MSLILFGRNTAIYAMGNVGLRAASFLLVPLYAHNLTVRDYGLLATLLITIQIMIIVMNLGMRTSLVRFTQEYIDNNQIKDLLGTTILVNLFGGLIVCAVTMLLLIPFLRVILHTQEVSELVILTCCASLMQSLSIHIMSYYRARQEAIKFMVIGISSAVLLITTNYILLRIYHMGIVGALFAYIFTHTVIFGLTAFEVLMKNSIGISFPLMPRLVRFGFPLVFSMISAAIITEASIYFLSYFSSLEVVAVFSLGFKLSQLLVITVIMPFQLAFQPFVYSSLKSPSIIDQLARMFIYFLIAIAFMSFFIILLSHIVLPLIAPPEYSDAFYVLLMLLPMMALIGIHYFNETLLSAVEQTHIIGIVMGACVSVCVVLYSLLIPHLNWIGAAIASNSTFFIVDFTLLFIGIRKLSLRMEWKRISVIVCMFFTYLFIMFFFHNKGGLVFYSGWTMMFLSSAALLYYGHFFHNEEKHAFRTSAERLRSAISS